MTPDSTAINALDAIRTLRSAGGALLDQVALHGQLAQVEWGEEKNRLLKMLVGALLGFACLLCVMLSLGALAAGVVLGDGIPNPGSYSAGCSLRTRNRLRVASLCRRCRRTVARALRQHA